LIEGGPKITSEAISRSHSGVLNLSQTGVLRTKRGSAIILKS